MKSCPTCNRTFEDTFTFCLVDGSILSAPFDPSEGRRPATPDHSPPTEVLIAPTVAAEKPAAAQSTIRAEAPRLPTPLAASRPISSIFTPGSLWFLRSALVLRGLLAMMFGVYALSSPRYGILGLPFSLYAIGVGLTATIAGLKSTLDYKIGWLLLVEGVFYLVVGICVYFHIFAFIVPGWFLEFIPPLCLVFAGVCQAGAAFQLRKHISGSWSLMVAGSASLLFGFALVVMLRVLWDPRLVSHHYVEPFVGVYGLVAGVLLIVAGVAIRGKKARA